MPRQIRVALEGLRAGEHTITGAPARYLTRVLRLREGARFTAFDPSARLESAVTVLELGRDSVRGDFSEPTPARAVGLPVTLIQCAGKGDKVDEVVRAATALGAAAIVIATSARSVTRAAATAERLTRLRAIALDAARQSGRGDLPALSGPLPLIDAAFPRAQPRLAQALPRPHRRRAARRRAPHARRSPSSLLVGPEGGFSPDERDAALAAGFALARLGSLVLRTELAGAAALGAVLAAE